jgi:hypothetical protein
VLSLGNHDLFRKASGQPTGGGQGPISTALSGTLVLLDPNHGWIDPSAHEFYNLGSEIEAGSSPLQDSAARRTHRRNIDGG